MSLSLLVGTTVSIITKWLPASLLNHAEYLNHLHPRKYKGSEIVVHKTEFEDIAVNLLHSGRYTAA